MESEKAYLENAEYWDGRKQQLQGQLETDEKRLNNQLAKVYDRESTKLDKEIAAYYQQYGEENVIEYRKLMESLPDEDKRLLIEEMDVFAEKYPQYTNLMPVRESIYKLNRLEGLQDSIYIQQMNIGAIEQKKIEEHMKKNAARFANLTAEQIGLGKNFYSIDSELIERTIGEKWCNDENYSDRIWGNRKKLAQTLNTDIAAAIARGDSYEKISRFIREKFSRVSQKQAYNLVYTEGTYLMNEASIQAFTDDYEEYIYSAHIDGKTCDTCRDLNGMKFLIEHRQPGANFPPMHTRCRCSYTIVISDNFIDKYVEQHGGDKWSKMSDQERQKQLEKKPTKPRKPLKNNGKYDIIKENEKGFYALDKDGNHVRLDLKKLSKEELQEMKESKGWHADWEELARRNETYGLYTSDGVLQCAGAFHIDNESGSVYLNWVVNAPQNAPNGNERELSDLGQNILAKAMTYSLDNGCGGYVIGDASDKKLVEYYMGKWGAEQGAVSKSAYPVMWSGQGVIDTLKKYNFLK